MFGVCFSDYSKCASSVSHQTRLHNICCVPLLHHTETHQSIPFLFRLTCTYLVKQTQFFYFPNDDDDDDDHDDGDVLLHTQHNHSTLAEEGVVVLQCSNIPRIPHLLRVCVRVRPVFFSTFFFWFFLPLLWRIMMKKKNPSLVVVAVVLFRRDFRFLFSFLVGWRARTHAQTTHVKDIYTHTQTHKYVSVSDEWSCMCDTYQRCCIMCPYMRVCGCVCVCVYVPTYTHTFTLFVGVASMLLYVPRDNYSSSANALIATMCKCF